MFDWIFNTQLVKVLWKQRDDNVMCFLLEFTTVICFYTAMYFYAHIFITAINKKMSSEKLLK